jgi:predicted metal-binding protein
MENLKQRREDKDFKDFSPVMTKECQGACDRQVVMTKEGPVIVCNGCMRIVMDNRDKK